MLRAVITMGGLLASSAAAAGEVLTFEDGYRAVLHPLPGARTVAVRTAFDRGWSDDPEELPGAAHLVEHLWFRARLEPEGPPLMERFRAEGCPVNGFTAPDRTSFVTSCAADALPLLLEAHALLVADPLRGVARDEVGIENRIVRFEEAQREGWLLQSGRAFLHRLLPDDHPAHTAWVAPDLRREPIEREALVDWTSQAHRPEDAVLIVAGAFDVESVRAELTEVHGAITSTVDRPPDPPSREPAPPVHRPRGERLEAPVSTPAVVLGWSLPAATPGAAGSAVAELLGSSLAEELEEEPVVLSAGCGYEEQAHIDALICVFQLAPGDQAEAMRLRIVRAAEDASLDALGGSELRRAAQELKGRRAGLESSLRALERMPTAVAARLEADLLRLGAPRTADEIVQDLRAWKPRRAVYAAADQIVPEHMAVLHVVPGEATFILEDPADEALAVPRLARPSERLDLPDGEVATATLGSGLILVAVREPNAVRTLASLRFGGGLDRFPSGLAWIAEQVTGTLAGRPGRGIAAGEGTGLDHTELYVWADPGRERAALKHLRHMAVRRIPGFSDQGRERLEARIDRDLARRRVARQEPATQAAEELLAAVVPGHAPSHGPSDEDLEAMRELDSGAMLAYLVQTYQPANGVLTVTGPEDPQVMLAEAAAVFESWQARSGVAPGPPMRAAVAGPPGRLTAFYEDPRASVSTVSWMCRLPDGTSAGLARVADELLHQRAWLELRARNGWTYTPSVDVVAWPDGTGLIHLQVGTRAAEVGAVLDALDGLVRDSDGDELARAKAVSLRRLMALRDSQVSAEAAVFAAIASGRDPTAPFAAARAPIDAVDAAGLGAALARCRATASWTVTGPAISRTVLELDGRIEASP